MNGPRVMLGMFLAVLALAAIAYALTTDQIWQKWYDSTNTAIRVSIVAGS